MNARIALVAACLAVATPDAARPAEPRPQTLDMPAEVLLDKIRGGLAGQLLGNLNGLPHEFKYIDEPGSVERYTPGLPNGARTDDDTDIEWVYVVAIQRDGRLLLPYPRIRELWQAHINRSIWSANAYARQLMEIGIDPPLSGHRALNPWATFNISGQFVCEAFGLIAPGMPQTAARTGVHYTHVAVGGEPIQSTQLLTAMIATAFVTDDMDAILDAGQAAVDPKSEIREIVGQVRAWHRHYPDDWRQVRRLVKQKYVRFAAGAKPDANGYALNTASVVAALLYGGGDFRRTLVTAFNFGWDADCNAATAGTIVGVVKGYRWMLAQGYEIKDVYRNTTRPGMPEDETITGYADRLMALAETVIRDNGGAKRAEGGAKRAEDGTTMLHIRLQTPANAEPLVGAAEEFRRLKADTKPEIEAALAEPSDRRQLARAAYLAICLDLAEDCRRSKPQAWAKAVDALAENRGLLDALSGSVGPDADRIKSRAAAAGVRP
jgi:ADP-ribosylglycohydrolase